MDCWNDDEICRRYGAEIKCIGSGMGDSLIMDTVMMSLMMHLMDVQKLHGMWIDIANK